MSRPMSELTRAELVRVEERSDRVVRRYVDEMIAAGRGHELPSQTARKDDPLSKLYTAAMEHGAGMAAEKRRRMAWHGSLHRIKQK